MTAAAMLRGHGGVPGSTVVLRDRVLERAGSLVFAGRSINSGARPTGQRPRRRPRVCLACACRARPRGRRSFSRLQSKRARPEGRLRARVLRRRSPRSSGAFRNGHVFPVKGTVSAPLSLGTCAVAVACGRGEASATCGGYVPECRKSVPHIWPRGAWPGYLCYGSAVFFRWGHEISGAGGPTSGLPCRGARARRRGWRAP